MKEALKYLKVTESYDIRQPGKVLHRIDEIIGISLFAMIAHESFLREYFELLNRILSHDIINRAFGMLPPEV